MAARILVVNAAQVRMLQEQVASLEADVSDMRADLAHLSAQYHSLKAAKGWYFSSRSSSMPVLLPAAYPLDSGRTGTGSPACLNAISEADSRLSEYCMSAGLDVRTPVSGRSATSALSTAEA